MTGSKSAKRTSGPGPEVSNISFPDFDLDETDLGGTLTWTPPYDESQVERYVTWTPKMVET